MFTLLLSRGLAGKRGSAPQGTSGDNSSVPASKVEGHRAGKSGLDAGSFLGGRLHKAAWDASQNGSRGPTLHVPRDGGQKSQVS